MRVAICTLAAVLLQSNFLPVHGTLTSRGLEPYDLAFEGEAQWVNLRARYGEDCQKYHTVQPGDVCSDIVDKYGIHLAEFFDWNTQVNSQCTNLKPGKKYCPTTTTSSPKSKSTAATKTAAKKPKPTLEGGSSSDKKKVLKKNVEFTYYWTAHPEDYTSGKKVAIKTCGGSTIARVAESFADALVMEGSGVVSKSTVVNLGSCACKNYACFLELNAKSEPFGLTAYGTSLDPYNTVAANDIKRNTKIYVPALDGWTLPGSSKKHNGCLLVDDKSWSFGGNHIDWFVNFKKHYTSLNSNHKVSKVDIYEGGDCQLLSY
ncbi:hypothetical protein DM01DRAFT_1390177 [Hesseltinella vesiculosa]|uniref:LysM domain-containing protein n=1 Tax=Hesseltinella vesiculosa TaxID=101127 RepID=A0A1X2GIN6_9FUNG|nr:hypothetical protein DM01DRAFT_1390177 [Hesseltinella vesiculosa]